MNKDEVRRNVASFQDCWGAWKTQSETVLQQVAKTVIEKFNIRIPAKENPNRILSQYHEAILNEVQAQSPQVLGAICFASQSVNIYADDNSGRSIMWTIVCDEVAREILRQLGQR